MLSFFQSYLMGDCQEHLAVLTRDRKAGLTTTLVTDRRAQNKYTDPFQRAGPLQQLSLCKHGLEMSWKCKNKLKFIEHAYLLQM